MVDRTLDTLAEFHMQHPDDAVYALMAHLISVLEANDSQEIDITFRNVTNLLGEVESTRILHVMCQHMHIDYPSLIQECQGITQHKVTPKLLLHLSVLPVSYVSKELQIDEYWASKLLDQFHKHFTIDSPILWLKSFLNMTEKERLRYGKEKEDLLHGLAVTGVPTDTAEYRRTQKLHHLRPDLKPPGSPD